MDGSQIIEKLQQAFGTENISVDEGSKTPGVFIPASLLIDVMRMLRNDPEFSMDFLNNITGCDMLGLKNYDGDHLRSVYHLYSYAHRHEFVISVNIERDDPVIPSLSELWASAIWMERESFDLLGIIYEGHPNLTRILLPTEFEGYPLRKDWEERSHVMGIETTRQTPVELLKFFHEKMGGEVPPGLELDLNPPTEVGHAPAQALPAAEQTEDSPESDGSKAPSEEIS